MFYAVDLLGFTKEAKPQIFLFIIVLMKYTSLSVTFAYKIEIYNKPAGRAKM